ncbi:MAG: cyclic pyranopterin monophosphate synthase MoaC [Planctomycetota bacterium]|jgi:cyclic pyranopterin phosphate synthase
MVDVSGKETTLRTATALAFVRMKPETLTAITGGNVPKGDVFATARIAAVLAAKKVPDLIPLCHPIRLDSIQVNLTPEPPDRVRIDALAKARDVTGVEMEALTAVTVASLTLYDMCKAIDRGIVLEDIRLLEKTGGKSGTWKRDDLDGA